jgi:hemoglobin/transferrin/lactoferrin receptor protein
MTTAAIYVSHSWEISEKVILSGGVRMSWINLTADFGDTTFYPLPYSDIKQSHIAPSGTIGAVYTPWKVLRLHASASTGFRAPNVDDLTKFFESTGGRLVVPNPDLNPEVAVGGEAGASWIFAPGARLEFTGFYTMLNDAIVVKDFTYNGADSVMYDGVLSRVVAPQNADKAFIYGFTTGLTADMNDHFSLYGTVTYTYGRYDAADNGTLIPMDHIPPVFGQAGLIYRTKGIEAEFFTRYNGWKRLADYSPSGEDNLSQATPYGMPAWTTINFRAQWHINRYIGVNLAVENIMDINYRHFASGVSAAGRNFIIGIRAHY